MQGGRHRGPKLDESAHLRDSLGAVGWEGLALQGCADSWSSESGAQNQESDCMSRGLTGSCTIDWIKQAFGTWQVDKVADHYLNGPSGAAALMAGVSQVLKGNN